MSLTEKKRMVATHVGVQIGLLDFSSPGQDANGLMFVYSLSYPASIPLCSTLLLRHQC